MKFPSIGVGRIVLIGGVLAIGVVLGSLTVKTTTASLLDKRSEDTTNYSKNESGQTYGSAVNALTAEEKPDLMEAYGEGGVKGYVRKKDLAGEDPKTPEEAIALMNKQIAEGPKTIPLYKEDGKTVIGVYKTGVGKVVENQKEER
ncbi:peptidase M56 BlaR1 [Paenibacillus hodogayensis]|uniref:Peptidase M56 BlaR1 n=1 Tax=Paenibacillus hodogayensis TaxID=279208 RepID=A0ABV5VSM2_9BACL